MLLPHPEGLQPLQAVKLFSTFCGRSDEMWPRDKLSVTAVISDPLAAQSVTRTHHARDVKPCSRDRRLDGPAEALVSFPRHILNCYAESWHDRK